MPGSKVHTPVTKGWQRKSVHIHWESASARHSCFWNIDVSPTETRPRDYKKLRLPRSAGRSETRTGAGWRLSAAGKALLEKLDWVRPGEGRPCVRGSELSRARLARCCWVQWEIRFRGEIGIGPWQVSNTRPTNWDYTAWRRGEPWQTTGFLPVQPPALPAEEGHAVCEAPSGPGVQNSLASHLTLPHTSCLTLGFLIRKRGNKNTVPIMRNNKIMCTKALSKLPGSRKCLINIIAVINIDENYVWRGRIVCQKPKRSWNSFFENDPVGAGSVLGAQEHGQGLPSLLPGAQHTHPGGRNGRYHDSKPLPVFPERWNPSGALVFSGSNLVIYSSVSTRNHWDRFEEGPGEQCVCVGGGSPAVRLPSPVPGQQCKQFNQPPLIKLSPCDKNREQGEHL